MVRRVQTVDPAQNVSRCLVVTTLRSGETTDERGIQRPPTAIVGSLVKTSRHQLAGE